MDGMDASSSSVATGAGGLSSGGGAGSRWPLLSSDSDGCGAGRRRVELATAKAEAAGEGGLSSGGGAPCGWEREPPGGAGRCSPWPECIGPRTAASARSSPVAKASLPTANRESSPAARGAAPRDEEEELRAAVMVANRQKFRVVASVCCMCLGCF
jgi:hypothetical protein